MASAMTSPVPRPMPSAARGLWFVGPRDVEIATVEIPPLADGQVLVRTTFSGISSGTELLAYRGELDPELPVDETIGALGGTFRFPFRYGYSCVGVVEESRSALDPGTPVFAFHPHQDRFVADADDVLELGSVSPRAGHAVPARRDGAADHARCRAGLRRHGRRVRPRRRRPADGPHDPTRRGPSGRRRAQSLAARCRRRSRHRRRRT